MLLPDHINIRLQPITVDELMAGIAADRIQKDRELDDVPAPASERSRYVESVLVGIPSPAFYIDGTKQPWIVLDGVKRLECLEDFVADRLPLKGMEYMVEYEGLVFSRLSAYVQNRFRNTRMMCYVMNPGTHSDVTANIKKRILTRL